jgi:hypothetical protein
MPYHCEFGPFYTEHQQGSLPLPSWINQWSLAPQTQPKMPMGFASSLHKFPSTLQFQRPRYEWWHRCPCSQLACKLEIILVRKFKEEGTPQEWIDLLKDLNKIWTQNLMTGGMDWASTMRAVVKVRREWHLF